MFKNTDAKLLVFAYINLISGLGGAEMYCEKESPTHSWNDNFGNNPRAQVLSPQKKLS